MSNALKALSADMVSRANSGHIGLPLGMADVVTVLYADFIKFYSKKPEWWDRDRFILSAGHGSALLYSLLHLAGYEKMSAEQIRNFRKFGSQACGHPEMDQSFGIEATTGPLGQGLCMAVGMAIAEKILNTRYGRIFDHKTYVLVGDGCLMEGISQEAISLAGHLELSKLVCLYDQNHISIDGSTSLACSSDIKQRFNGENWRVVGCDAHNMDDVHGALSEAVSSSHKPTLVICSSVIGKGIGYQQGTEKAHGVPTDKNYASELKKAMNWECPPFEVPTQARESWLATGQKHKMEYETWQESLLNHPKNTEIRNLLQGNFDLDAARTELEKLTAAPMPTRKSSQKVIEVLAKHIPQLIGGSSDLTESNCTRVKSMGVINKSNFYGRYIHYGVREHGMGATMNGMALHGGFIPYGGTFLVFTDYMRPAIRLAALMKQKVIYVCTHDSIGLGEDGPTHQPVEHLDSLRAIPNLRVFRPADLVETAECWQLALQYNGPSILALSRQILPAMHENPRQNFCALGGYEVVGGEDEFQLTLIGTGSELHLATDVHKMFKKDGVKTRVVSLPCIEIFEDQPQSYIDKILGAKPRAIIEAGTCKTLQKYIRLEQDMIFSIDSFGGSAPYQDLYHHFAFIPDKIYSVISEKMRGNLSSEQ